MKRRTALRWMASAAAALPFTRLHAFARQGELPPESLATLREVAATVLPSSLGPAGVAGAVDRFLEWMRGYREGMALQHGYGHPSLRFTPASPVPGYAAQLAALDRAARAKGASFAGLDLDARRALLDAAFAEAGVDRLPPRPSGRHVAADLMGHYFNSSAAADFCYQAHIGRQTCRLIPVTTRRPAPFQAGGGPR